MKNCASYLSFTAPAHYDVIITCITLRTVHIVILQQYDSSYTDHAFSCMLDDPREHSSALKFSNLN